MHRVPSRLFLVFATCIALGLLAAACAIEPTATHEPKVIAEVVPSVGVIMDVPIQGRQHVRPGDNHPPYNSVPPTSGWHYGSSAPWGIHYQIEDELQVHNLEHGGVLIQYDSKDADLIGNLEALAQRQAGYPCYLIVAPYDELHERGATIALTAWGVILYLDRYDDAAIQKFINTYLDKGPEQVPCTQ